MAMVNRFSFSRLAIVLGLTCLTLLSGVGLVYAQSVALTNPGFEIGDFTGWTNSGFSVSSAQANTGVYSAHSPDFSSGDLSQSVSFDQSTCVLGGVQFAVYGAASGWVASGWSDCGISYSWFNSVSSWTYYELYRASCSGLGDFIVRFISNSGDGGVYIDDIDVFCADGGGSSGPIVLDMTIPQPLDVSVVEVSPVAFSGADFAILAVISLFGFLIFTMLVLLFFRTR